MLGIERIGRQRECGRLRRGYGRTSSRSEKAPRRQGLVRKDPVNIAPLILNTEVSLTFTVPIWSRKDILSTVLESSRSFVAVVGASRLAELNHTGLEVVERSFDEALLVLVMGQEVMPKCVL